MATRTRKKGGKSGYMISAVAEMYSLHPQTLRLYEREGLLAPSRSEGNTRLYTQEDLDRLEAILSLTRDLGVNLAGIEVILNMRQRMDDMQREMQAFVEFVNRELLNRSGEDRDRAKTALARMAPTRMIRPVKK
jgi:MerR family transcriptional regulator, heat shock protein HspR